jgi:hypothetical protein
MNITYIMNVGIGWMNHYFIVLICCLHYLHKPQKDQKKRFMPTFWKIGIKRQEKMLAEVE